jgi:hypothetical protein
VKKAYLEDDDSTVYWSGRGKGSAQNWQTNHKQGMQNRISNTDMIQAGIIELTQVEQQHLEE